MGNTEINRRIVQKGLNRKAAARRDAELEAQARKLRLIINANHTAKLAEQYPSPQTQRRQEEAKAKAESRKRKQEIRKQRATEASYCIGWYKFLLRVYTPLMIAAATIGMYNRGSLHYALAFPCAIVACMICISTFAGRFLHNER